MGVECQSSANLPEHKPFPLNLGSIILFGFLLQISCTDGFCSYLQTPGHPDCARPTAMCTAEFMHVLKDYFVSSVPSPCLTRDWIYKHLGHPFFVDDVSRQKDTHRMEL